MALINSDKNNFAPRLGFAYRPFKKDKLQIRGGYSLFYDSTVYGTDRDAVGWAASIRADCATAEQHIRPLTIQDGFGNDPTKEVTNTFAVAHDYVLPYAQTWNFALQEEFGGGLVVEANYLGTKGTRLDVLRLPNRAAPGSPLTAEQRRQIGNAVGFTYRLVRRQLDLPRPADARDPAHAARCVHQRFVYMVEVDRQCF